MFCVIFFLSSIQPAEVQEREGKSDKNPIPGGVSMSGYVLWVKKRGEMGQAALETAQVVSNYTFSRVVSFTARNHLFYMGHSGHVGTACHYLAMFRPS